MVVRRKKKNNSTQSTQNNEPVQNSDVSRQLERRNPSNSSCSNGAPLDDQIQAHHAEGLYCSGEVRILVVDDDETVGEIIYAALEDRDFQIDIISKPTELRGQLEREQYQLIILDYNLPPLESDEVLEWINETQQDTSIIVVTAYPSMDGALNCLRAHTYDYITKPFSITHLVDQIVGCLEQRGLLRLSAEALREALGASIRERRAEKGLTLAQMGERTGISLGYLSQIELGKNSASIETLYRIALGLGVRLSDLFQALKVDA